MRLANDSIVHSSPARERVVAASGHHVYNNITRPFAEVVLAHAVENCARQRLYCSATTDLSRLLAFGPAPSRSLARDAHLEIAHGLSTRGYREREASLSHATVDTDARSGRIVPIRLPCTPAFPGARDAALAARTADGSTVCISPARLAWRPVENYTFRERLSGNLRGSTATVRLVCEPATILSLRTDDSHAEAAGRLCFDSSDQPPLAPRHEIIVHEPLGGFARGTSTAVFAVREPPFNASRSFALPHAIAALCAVVDAHRLRHADE